MSFTLTGTSKTSAQASPLVSRVTCSRGMVSVCGLDAPGTGGSSGAHGQWQLPDAMTPPSALRVGGGLAVFLGVPAADSPLELPLVYSGPDVGSGRIGIFPCSQGSLGSMGTLDTCDAERESTRLPRSPVPTAPHCSPGALNDRTSPLNPHFGGVSISARQ